MCVYVSVNFLCVRVFEVIFCVCMRLYFACLYACNRYFLCECISNYILCVCVCVCDGLYFTVNTFLCSGSKSDDLIKTENIYIYIYIYIERERERERKTKIASSKR